MTASRAGQVATPDALAGRRRFWWMLALDVVAPLVLYYALRLFGVSQWTALVVGAVIPLLRITLAAAVRRRLELPALFTLTLLAAGTAIGLLTAEPRVLMARGSLLTAVVGGWILLTLATRRPLVFTATLGFMPAAAADEWRRSWDTSPLFRRAMRGMTLAFGVAFLLDAVARVVMAYTLPLDLVPVLSALLLVLMLVAVVQGGKAYGRRHSADASGRL